MRLVLASGSPRRQSLLKDLGLSFDIRVPDVDESVLPGESAQTYVERLSLAKAQAVVPGAGEVVLAADTTVVHSGKILGKPESKQDAINMLAAMSGSTHTVITGVTLLSESTGTTFSVATEVTFRVLHPDEIVYYWETGEPIDKAGSYGLQGIGAAFVETITGSYTNVIGLPVAETVALLREHELKCLGVGAGDKESLLAQGGRNG